MQGRTLKSEKFMINNRKKSDKSDDNDEFKIHACFTSSKCDKKPRSTNGNNNSPKDIKVSSTVNCLNLQ